MMGFRFEMDIMHAECESFRVPAVLVSLNADYCYCYKIFYWVKRKEFQLQLQRVVELRTSPSITLLSHFTSRKQFAISV